MTSFFRDSSGRPRSSCSSVNMHVITSLWEGSTTFCCSVSGFADLTSRNNKPDGSSDFTGQKQHAKANSGDKVVCLGREITCGMIFKRRTSGWMGGNLARILGVGGNRACNEDRKVTKHNTRNSAPFTVKYFWCAYGKNIFTAIQAAVPLFQAGGRLTPDVAPVGPRCTGQHPDKASAGRWERIFQVFPLLLLLCDLLSKKKKVDESNTFS